MKRLLLPAFLAICVGCSGAFPTGPSPQAMDRFLDVLKPERQADQKQVQDALNACFRVGAPAAGYSRVLQQAHSKVTKGTKTYYDFYPGKSKGEEDDLHATVVVDGDPGVIVEYWVGVYIS